MSRFAALVVFGLALLPAACQNHGPSTKSYVYNLSLAAFTVEGHEVEVGSSRAVYTANGATDTVKLARGSFEWSLVITSLVGAEDPENYDAAINVHEDVAESLYCLEYSPYIDAEIVGP